MQKGMLLIVDIEGKNPFEFRTNGVLGLVDNGEFNGIMATLIKQQQ